MAHSSRTLWTRKLTGKSLPVAQAAPLGLSSKGLSGIILGIDPSLRGTGLALIDVQGDSRSLLYSQRVYLPASKGFFACLGLLSESLETLLKRFHPQHAALEQTIYVQNTRVAQILGAARGALIATLMRHGITSLQEYPPTRIKQAITGSGRASKEQVQRTVQALLSCSALPSLDESDAAATALCHAFCGVVAPV